MKMASVLVAISASTLVALARMPAVQDDTAPNTGRAFEVASIKQNRDGGPVAGMRRTPGGRFEATNIQLAALIGFAYQLQPFELVGGPDWLMSDRWDVIAKIDGDPPRVPPGQLDAMMIATQALLADRFRLVVHRETREIPVYQLMPRDPAAASLFTVLQEQLGLKLEAARLPMPVTVIDRVERPIEG